MGQHAQAAGVEADAGEVGGRLGPRRGPGGRCRHSVHNTCAHSLCTRGVHESCAIGVVAGQRGCEERRRAIWGVLPVPVDLTTVVPCALGWGRRSLSGARGIRQTHFLRRPGTPHAYLHPEAGRDHALVARDRRDRRRARPPREPDRHPAARQAQADLRPPRRRGRLRHHHQRRQGGPHRRQGRAEEGLPPLRLPGWSDVAVLHRAPREEPGEGCREGRSRHAPQELPSGVPSSAKLKVYAGGEHPHAAQQPQPFQITQVAQ